MISRAFNMQGWDKSVLLYENYLEEQRQSRRDFILAMLSGEFAGYVTIKWNSRYQSFLQNGVPEISDLNVLERYWRNGIGSALVVVLQGWRRARRRASTHEAVGCGTCRAGDRLRRSQLGGLDSIEPACPIDCGAQVAVEVGAGQLTQQVEQEGSIFQEGVSREHQGLLHESGADGFGLALQELTSDGYVASRQTGHAHAV